MKIDRISANKITRVYGKNKAKEVGKIDKPKGDSVEISTIGKNLSSYSIDKNTINSKEKIEKLRMEVSTGTYNRDSKLVAYKMIDIMKGKEV